MKNDAYWNIELSVEMFPSSTRTWIRGPKCLSNLCVHSLNIPKKTSSSRALSQEKTFLMIWGISPSFMLKSAVSHGYPFHNCATTQVHWSLAKWYWSLGGEDTFFSFIRNHMEIILVAQSGSMSFLSHFLSWGCWHATNDDAHTKAPFWHTSYPSE